VDVGWARLHLDWTIKWVRECGRVLLIPMVSSTFSASWERGSTFGAPRYVLNAVPKRMQFHDMTILGQGGGIQ